MLKTLSIELPKSRKSKIKVGVNDRDKLNGRNEFGNIEVSGNKVEEKKVEDNQVARKKNHQKMSKSKKTVSFSDFFTAGTRLAFTKLK